MNKTQIVLSIFVIIEIIFLVFLNHVNAKKQKFEDSLRELKQYYDERKLRK